MWIRIGCNADRDPGSASARDPDADSDPGGKKSKQRFHTKLTWKFKIGFTYCTGADTGFRGGGGLRP